MPISLEVTVGVLMGLLLSIVSNVRVVLAAAADDAASNHSYSLIADYMTLHGVRPDLDDKVAPFTTVGNVITACGESTVPISDAESTRRETSNNDFRSLCTDFMTYAKNYCASSDPSKDSELSICKNGDMLKSMKNYETVNK